MLMTNWTYKYRNRPEFLSWFESEQEYVDAMFVQIVMFNYGIAVDPAKLKESPARS